MAKTAGNCGWSGKGLLDEAPNDVAEVRVHTSVDGFDTVWHATLERFFAHTPLAGRWELNDFGATPAVVTLRLRQAAEAATTAQGDAP